MPSISPTSGRIKLRQLEILSAVVECGTMGKAAGRLAISQPVISKAIADLEHTLGVRLLDRSPQGIEATLYGRALLKRSVAVFDELTHGVKELEYLADPTAGELRIGASEAIAAGLLAAIIDPLTRRYPRIALHVTQADTVTLLKRDLRNRNIDLIIGRLPIPAEDTQTETLFNEQPFVVAGPRNRWVGRRRIKLSDLLNEPWCLPPPETLPGSMVANAFQARGLPLPRTAVTALSIHLQNALLVNGRFLTILPGAMLRFSAARMSLKVLPVDLPKLHWPVGIATLKNRTLNPAAQLFIECARQVTKSLVKR